MIPDPDDPRGSLPSLFGVFRMSHFFLNELSQGYDEATAKSDPTGMREVVKACRTNFTDSVIQAGPKMASKQGHHTA